MKLINILTSGHLFSIEENPLKLKYILFNSMLLFNIILVSIIFFIRLKEAQYGQAFFDIVYVLFATITLFLARYSKKYFNKIIFFTIFFSYFTVTFLFYKSTSITTGMSWYYILLLITFFLAGKRGGAIVFVISFISIIYIYTNIKTYMPADIVLGIAPFVVFVVFMYFFEERNLNLQHLLEKQNRDLNDLYSKSSSELAKLQEVLYQSPVSIIITDPQGNIEYMNPWFSKLTGYEMSEVKGKNPKVLKSKMHSDDYYKTLWDDITHGKVWNGVFKNVKKDGTLYWEKAIIAPVKDKQGTLSNFIAIKQEITQQVYLEEEILKKDKDEIENFEKTLESFVRIVEERDTYTAGHSNRVAMYSKMIAEEMGFSADECSLLYRAAMLHDIGKVATPDNVLLKPGKLSNLEYRLIQEHVKSSYDILSRIPMYKDFANIIIHHHEHYDGSGYPYGKKEDEIPLLAHILIVADAFDAMTTNRIYKGRKDLEEAFVELERCSGTQFHPVVVKNTIKALADVELYNTVNQLPKTDLEKERFSYFYRDQVTRSYNGDYLTYVLNQNNFTKEFRCIHILFMHNFSVYNSKEGWAKGDLLLNSVSNYLIKLFPESMIFRIHGDDFILIQKEHIEINMQELNGLDFLVDNNINLTTRHIDLKDEIILTLEQLEQLEQVVGDIRG